MSEDPAYLAETKARCGYRAPPQALTDATLGHYLGDAPWNALHDWLDANAEDGNTALLVYLAERYDQTISEAYAATDGYAKSRDPDYVNYN